MRNGTHVHLAGCKRITSEVNGETHEMLKECMGIARCHKLLNVCGTQSARLPSEEAYWETMKERTRYVCQNAENISKHEPKTRGNARRTHKERMGNVRRDDFHDSHNECTV